MRVSAALLINALVVAALWLSGFHAGQIAGLLGLFYVYLIPCALLAAFFIAPYGGGIAAVIGAAMLSAWLSWASVTDPRPADDPDLCNERRDLPSCR